MKARRGRRAHTNHERWLVSYADFMTLLFALFVVLFASSQHQAAAIRRVSSAVRDGFKDMSAFAPSSEAASAPEAAAAPAPAVQAADVDITHLQAELRQTLREEIARKQVVLRTTPEGFVISLHELGFFDSGEARLLPGAAAKIQRLAAVLMRYGVPLRVEGHSDNVPIHNARFDSNWDLSTARANTVARLLLAADGFDPARLSVAGYGEYHPAADNATPEGRQANRRVDIVVLSTRPSQR